MAYAIGELGFEQLEAVCNYMVAVVERGGAVQPVALPLGIVTKVEFNSLGHRIERLLALGLAATGEVARFIDFTAQSRPDFGQRLRAFFRARYADGLAEGLARDELFDFVHAHAVDHAGPDLEATSAAALAVVAHMFEVCEVFESAYSAA
jgi:hypothetical protein